MKSHGESISDVKDTISDCVVTAVNMSSLGTSHEQETNRMQIVANLREIEQLFRISDNLAEMKNQCGILGNK